MFRDKAKGDDCNWFKNWFDSRYYHILYKNRNEEEACRFMDNLVRFLDIPKGSKIHDLACGKGRHSIFLAKKGFDVTGTDLSAESIRFAQQFAGPGLSFFVNDMRSVFKEEYFDFVFNLFTSFGYFPEEKDNEDVLKAVYASLKPGGVFVLDYLNANRAILNMVKEETKSAGGINFKIEKRLENGCFMKQIHFRDQGKEYHFKELVRAFSKEDLERMLYRSGFKIEAIKGNYELEDFDEEKSDRLILISRKPGSKTNR